MQRLHKVIATSLGLVMGVTGVSGAQVVINEVLYDGPGSDMGMFTELKGEPGLSLDGYSLVGVNGSGGVVYRTIDLTGNVIPADGYFVVAQDGTVANGDFVTGDADWQNGADQVQLLSGSTILDSVCYGSDPDLVCEGGTNAPDVTGGTSLARCPDGSDTDDNMADFLADETPTPGEMNDVVCGGGMQALIINEVLYDGPGGDAGMFTELLGTPGMSLDGHALLGVNGNGGVVYATIPLDGQAIPADGYWVGGQDATTPNADLIDPLFDFQNGADQVVLVADTGDGFYDLTDDILDSVCYGSDPDLVCEGMNAPDVPSGTSLARCPDGEDTDDNSADFVADLDPTPGAENDADCSTGGGDPTDYTLCDLAENDAAGFPVRFAELVRVTDVVAISATGQFRAEGSGLEIQVYQPSTGCCITLFDFNYDSLTNPIAEGQMISEIIGTVEFFNGKTEIGTLQSLVLGGMGTQPAPVQITTNELATNGEAYDNCLIEICGVTITEGTWPADGSSTNLTIDDGTGPVTLRVDSDTDIDGSAAPTEPFTLVGIAGQFDSSSPYDSGYQILPRKRIDILDDTSCPTPIEEKSWSAIKNQYR